MLASDEQVLLVAAPFILPSHVWAAPPSNKVVMGFVGVGIQSRGLMGSFLPRTQVVAVCDVDTTRRTDAQQKVNQHYKKSDCKAFEGHCEGSGKAGDDSHHHKDRQPTQQKGSVHDSSRIRHDSIRGQTHHKGPARLRITGTYRYNYFIQVSV